MKLSEIKDLIIFCKQHGVEYVENDGFKASIPKENTDVETPGNSEGYRSAGLFDHLDGREPDFTELPREDS